MGGSDHCYLILLDAGATADVLIANNNDLNIDETRTIHLA